MLKMAWVGIGLHMEFHDFPPSLVRTRDHRMRNEE